MIEDLDESIFGSGDNEAAVGPKRSTQRLLLKPLQRARDLQRSRVVDLHARGIGDGEIVGGRRTELHVRDGAISLGHGGRFEATSPVKGIDGVFLFTQTRIVTHHEFLERHDSVDGGGFQVSFSPFNQSPLIFTTSLIRKHRRITGY